jgi:hypothetical protein
LSTGKAGGADVVAADQRPSADAIAAGKRKYTAAAAPAITKPVPRAWADLMSLPAMAGAPPGRFRGGYTGNDAVMTV